MISYILYHVRVVQTSIRRSQKPSSPHRNETLPGSIIRSMGKSKKGNKNGSSESESKVAPILEIGYSDPLFSTVAHPTHPIIVSGLGTGHVLCHTYDPEVLGDTLKQSRDNFLSKRKSSNLEVSQLAKKLWRYESDHKNIGSNDDAIRTNWKTKRHKGSCRSVLFETQESSVGESIYTVGTDHIIKKAKTETGKVESKGDVSLSFGSNSKDAVTTLAVSATHPFLLSGTENGNVFVFDKTNLTSNQLKYKIDGVHGDAVNKILPMPAVSPYHFLTLGSTTLSHIDIRKGSITQSDDQSDELMSMCYPSKFVNDYNNDTLLVSHGEGIITLWKNSKNNFMDQISRIRVNKHASIDAIMPTMNLSERFVDSVWCGDTDGLLHRVDYKKGRVLEKRVHSSFMSKSGAVDEVGGLDIDFEYRLISSGMEGLKIWSEEPLFEAEPNSSSNSTDVSDSEDSSLSDDDMTSSSMMSQDSFDDESEIDNETENNFSKDEIKEESPHKNIKNSTMESKGYQKTCERKKTRSGEININRLTKLTTNQEKEEEPMKKKRKQIRNKVLPNGISRFDGL